MPVVGLHARSSVHTLLSGGQGVVTWFWTHWPASQPAMVQAFWSVSPHVRAVGLRAVVAAGDEVSRGGELHGIQSHVAAQGSGIAQIVDPHVPLVGQRIGIVGLDHIGVRDGRSRCQPWRLPGSGRLPQPLSELGTTKNEPAGPTKQGSAGPAQQTAFPNTPLIGRLPSPGGTRTLSPPKSATSKDEAIFVVSPQVSACPRLIVQFVTLLIDVSQMSLVHSSPSTQSAFGGAASLHALAGLEDAGSVLARLRLHRGRPDDAECGDDNCGEPGDSESPGAFPVHLAGLPLARRASTRVASSLGAGPTLDGVASLRRQAIVKEKMLESVGRPCHPPWNRWTNGVNGEPLRAGPVGRRHGDGPETNRCPTHRRSG